MGKVRMADIAAALGVSTVTVHNALTGQKGVSDQLRMRILETAETMGYRKRRPAETLLQGERAPCIGVLIPERFLAEYATFYTKMYQEMALEAAEKGCVVTVEILKAETEKAAGTLPKMVEEQSVDGLILMGDTNRNYIHFLKKKLSFPIVFLDFYDVELAKDSVIADNFYGMYLMTEYLYEQGFDEMAFVGSLHFSSSIMDRFCGFYKAVLKHHGTLPEEWLIEDRDEEGQIVVALPEKMPQAFVCNCDLTAGTLIMELEKKGIHVPEDVSVVGFDNYLYPGFPWQKVTSYEVNTKAMVKVALGKVLKQLRSKGSGKNLEIITGKIVQKDSVRKKGKKA